MKKKILAFMLCMLLVANPCLASSTGVVTVSGGSIATGGLSGGYSEKTESAALTLTMAMLYGLGVSVKLSQDAINAGQSAYSFVKSKFYEWVGGTSAEQLDDSQYEELKSRFEVINSGSNIDPGGNIYFNATAVDLIRRFLNWLDVSDYIHSNNSSVIEGQNGTINNVSTFYGSSIGFVDSTGFLGINQSGGRYYDSSPAVDCLVYRYYVNVDGSVQIRYLIVNVDSGYQWQASNYDANGRFSSDGTIAYNVRNGYRYCIHYERTGATLPNSVKFINSIDDTRGESTIINTFLDGGNGSIQVGGDSSEFEEGFNYEGDFDPSVLNNPDDNNLVVQPDLVQGLQENNPNQQINIPVEQYLEALKQILNQATNPQAVPEPIPAQDLPTLSPVPVDVPADLPLEWPVELPSSPDATPDLPTDNTPVTDPSTPVQPVDALPELTFNLDEYFPFCIPFDIYNLLSKFSADPVTPEFDIGFTDPFSDTDVTLHIDLHDWDSVASAIRTAELGAFIVGLAVASRSIFTRG